MLIRQGGVFVAAEQENSQQAAHKISKSKSMLAGAAVMLALACGLFFYLWRGWRRCWCIVWGWCCYELVGLAAFGPDCRLLPVSASAEKEKRRLLRRLRPMPRLWKTGWRAESPLGKL